jgi:hypothetical protein
VAAGRLETRSRTNRAVYVGGCATAAANDVVVIIADTRFISSRLPGKLNAPNETGDHQGIEVVINRLG